MQAYPHPVGFVRVSRAHLSIAPLHIQTASRHAHQWGPKAGVGWNATGAQTGGIGMMHSARPEQNDSLCNLDCAALAALQLPALPHSASTHALSRVETHSVLAAASGTGSHSRVVLLHPTIRQFVTLVRKPQRVPDLMPAVARDSRRTPSNSTGACGGVLCPPRCTARRHPAAWAAVASSQKPNP